MKSLILYYSYGGNTRGIAQKLQKALGADLAEIKTLTPYTGNYDDVVDQGQREVSEGFLPQLLPLGVDLKGYDAIVLGTPVWWYTFAPAMNSFFAPGQPDRQAGLALCHQRRLAGTHLPGFCRLLPRRRGASGAERPL